MSKTFSGIRVLLSCAALAAACSIAEPGTARAACQNWSLVGDAFSVNQSNGLRIYISRWSGIAASSTAWGALYLADGTPAQVNSDGQPVQHGNHNIFSSPTVQQDGPVFGRINGNHMDFSVEWEHVVPGVTNHYTGDIAANGTGANGETVNTHGTGDTWSTTATFTCAT